MEAEVARFMRETNFLRALGFQPDATRNEWLGAPQDMYKTRLDQLRTWAAQRQRVRGANTVDARGLEVVRKVATVQRILCTPTLESCYLECLRVAPDFAYPVELQARAPWVLAAALLLHLARKRGYKRVEDTFYVPHAEEEGRVFFKAMTAKELVSTVLGEEAPNLLMAVAWSKRTGAEELQNMLRDPVHFPSVPVSKRYLGFSNVVYDLEQNTTLTWPEVRRNPDIMPFNCLKCEFPCDALERAKESCPRVSVDPDTGRLAFTFAEGQSLADFCPTPLFEGPLRR